MCGIVGFCGSEAAAPLVIEALRCVEYRGYDSAGIAVLSAEGLLIKKDIGKLDEINSRHSLSAMPGNIAIGHTRWATHGGVTAANAHPHKDCRDEIAVVHNGIIQNYQTLRDELLDRGHRFTSETDTEVISHLLEDAVGAGQTLEEAVPAVAKRLEGSYAFLAISTRCPDVVVGIRRGNPMVVGMSPRGCFVTSDALAFPGHVTTMVPMGENETVVLRANCADYYDNTGNKLFKKATPYHGNGGTVGKNGNRYYMLKEIMEQPEVLEQALTQDKELFTDIAMDILRAGHVVIIACGTSRYAALVGRYLFSRVGRKFCDVVMASEFQYFTESVGTDTLVIAVSQSGETADVIEGVKRAREAGARVISVINRPMSQLSDMSDRIIYLNCGPELCVAATKSFISQLVVFYLLAYSMINDFDKAATDLRAISAEITKVIEWNGDRLKALSERLKDKRDFYYIARGINFAIASEAALKAKEVSYIHAEGMPAGELKHGTLALIEPGTPVAVICPDDYTYQETLSNAIEARSRGAYIIAVSDIPNEVYDFWIKIPRVSELLYPIVTTVPLQLLAYYLAVARGHDPDKPRNLAKSVTVK
jgi:glutamine---fructose-6-phosphate transaminase (isomerizing)